MKEELKKKKLDCTNAWASFILTCFFWIPLLNLGILPLSIYFGIKAVVKAKKYPKNYGGRKLAIFSIIWAVLSLILAIIFLILDVSGKI